MKCEIMFSLKTDKIGRFFNGNHPVVLQPIKVYIPSKHKKLSVNDENILISYMATCFGFIKAIIRPIYNTNYAYK